MLVLIAALLTFDATCSIGLHAVLRSDGTRDAPSCLRHRGHGSPTSAKRASSPRGRAVHVAQQVSGTGALSGVSKTGYDIEVEYSIQYTLKCVRKHNPSMGHQVRIFHGAICANICPKPSSETFTPACFIWEDMERRNTQTRHTLEFKECTVSLVDGVNHVDKQYHKCIH